MSILSKFVLCGSRLIITKTRPLLLGIISWPRGLLGHQRTWPWQNITDRNFASFTKYFNYRSHFTEDASYKCECKFIIPHRPKHVKSSNCILLEGNSNKFIFSWIRVFTFFLARGFHLYFLYFVYWQSQVKCSCAMMCFIIALFFCIDVPP